MLIGKLAKESGCSRDTIRYYEKLGLIQASTISRLANNYKNYPQQALERLIQIREFKAAGFTLNEIKQLLVDFENTNQPCSNLPTKLNQKISNISEQIKTLEQYKQTLLKINDGCDGNCDSQNGLPSCMSAS